MSAYKVGDTKFVYKFLWLPMKFDDHWHWLKDVCLKKQLVATTTVNHIGQVIPWTTWKTIKVMEL